MRHLHRCAALVAAILVIGYATTAGAFIYVDLIWTSSSGAGTVGDTMIEAETGDVLTLDILLTSTEFDTITAYGVSLAFDWDGGDELNVSSAVELLPTGFVVNATPGVGGIVESVPGDGGFVLNFEADSLGFGGGIPFGATRLIGQVDFQVNTPSTDGVDVVSYFSGSDGFFGPGGVAFDPELAEHGSASVDAPGGVPEPSTGVLFAFGLAGLACTGRRRLP